MHPMEWNEMDLKLRASLTLLHLPENTSAQFQTFASLLIYAAHALIGSRYAVIHLKNITFFPLTLGFVLISILTCARSVLIFITVTGFL